MSFREKIESLLSEIEQIKTEINGYGSIKLELGKAAKELAETLERTKALKNIHTQNEQELRKARITSLQEFKSLILGNAKIKQMLAQTIEKIEENQFSLRTVSKVISTLDNDLKRLRQEVKILQETTGKLLEFKYAYTDDGRNFEGSKD